ncbi:hypothetical protein BDN72DRAFT_376439 [Pluteus cervinus]|uniref:Uncharacterized protein n=1 Tax=Pluteus cervinus TaxID=181527 RepID=A0ACD3AAN2_9AGAR|nr:hypothetical protein BDN72DRAFT_376439 [Pluteus cervinus]
MLTVYTLVGMMLWFLTWFNISEHTDVLHVANRPELIISTIATSLPGYAGILLNNHRFLATYTFLTWLTFASLITPGYITCRRHKYNLEGNSTFNGLVILVQADELGFKTNWIVGYSDLFVSGVVTRTRYSRRTLRGCKLRFLGSFFGVVFLELFRFMCMLWLRCFFVRTM